MTKLCVYINMYIMSIRCAVVYKVFQPMALQSGLSENCIAGILELSRSSCRIEMLPGNALLLVWTIAWCMVGTQRCEIGRLRRGKDWRC